VRYSNLPRSERKGEEKSPDLLLNFALLGTITNLAELIFVRGIVSLSTLKGRVKVPLKLSAFHQQFTHGRYCISDLTYRRGSRFLNIVLEFPTPEMIDPTDCIGVDLGVNRLAVTSQGDFYSSKHLHTLVARHQKLKGDLQSKRSKSARKNLRRSLATGEGFKGM